MVRFVILVLIIPMVVSCGGPPTPTPDAVATQVAVEEAAHATMTAKAPTATAEPTETNTPTPTITPTATLPPSAIWKTWESRDLAVSIDYPSSCEAKETKTGWQCVDPSGWLMSVDVLDRADYPDDWGAMLEPGRIQASQLVEIIVNALDMSLTADFVLISDDPIIDLPGLDHAWNTRYREKNYLRAVEVLILKNNTREWFFSFVENGSEYKQWTDRAKDSIKVGASAVPVF